MAEYKKPLPIPDTETEEYWKGCKRHELLMPRCKTCGQYCFPPLPMCPTCNAMDQWEWSKVSGKGKIYAWTVVHHATHPDFKEDAPYMCVQVELDDQEDLRLVSTMVDCTSEEIRAGMPVEVVFDDVTADFTLPRFKKI